MPTTVPRVQAVPLTDDQVSFQVAGRERLRWHGRPNAPRPFFFPLIGPAGRSLSRMGHPADPTYDHHRSLFLGHRDVAGLSFWEDGPRDTPGPTIRQDAWQHYQDGPDDAGIAVELGWYDVHKVRLIRQHLIAVYRPLAEGEGFIELQTTFVPELDEMTLGRTDFGFLGLRVAASLSTDYGSGKVTNSEGDVGEAAAFHEPARWADFSGPIVDGIEEGVTWFDHPANPRHPARWHVRDDGWFSPAFCQRDAYVLRRAFPPTLRYGLHVHRGPHDAERATAMFAAFGASPAWKLDKAEKPWKWHLRVRGRLIVTNPDRETMEMATTDTPKDPAAAGSAPTSHPRAIWYFFWGEFAERSSYYGMRAILFLYMTKALGMSVERAAPAYAGFKAACYLLPLAGGYIADRWLGRYWTIVGFSVPYVIGQFLLSGFPNEIAMFAALALLASGSGVIKPNISTMMGETYDEKRPNQPRLRTAAFLWFYFSINIGALVSMLALPLVRQHYILNDSRITPEVRVQLESALAEGKDILPITPNDVLKDAFSVAFAIPAWLMVGSLIIFALGKPHYAHKRPEVHHLTPEERRLQWKTLVRLFGIFGLVVIFWFGYEHNDTLWIEFISNHVNLKLPFADKTIAPDQLQFLNALFVIILVPTFNLMFGKLDPQVKIFTPMRKVLAGFILTAAAVAIMATAGFIVGADPTTKVSVFWPASAYIVLTFGEVLLYGTMLEIAYTAAPKSMKGFVTACFLLTNTLGNFMNMVWMPLYDKRIAPGPFFAATAGCVVLAALAFVVIGKQFERSQAEAEQSGLT